MTAALSTPSPFSVGTVLVGKYRLERLLGEGGMGWVYVAMHLHLEQRVAIKFMRPTAAGDAADATARFLREARAAARVQSEHVARVSDFGTLDDGAPYLVMEYLEGQDLESWLHAHGALPVELAVDYAIQACEGLAEAHAAGIVHRDLKPANLFLARRSDSSVRVKLLDFGISKLVDANGAAQASMTSTQALMGSPLYMAPEQMRSSKSVDVRADIWSMGVILYEMLSGRSPFEAETLPGVCSRIMTEDPAPIGGARQEVPKALEAAVRRCLEKEPGKRFAEVGGLVQAIGPFGSAESQSAVERVGRLTRGRQSHVPGAPSTAERPDRSSRRVAQTSATFASTGDGSPTRRRALFPVAIAAVSLTVVGAVILALAMRHSAASAPSASSAPSLAAAGVRVGMGVERPTANPVPSAAPSSVHSAEAEGATTVEPPTVEVTDLPVTTSHAAAAAGAGRAGKPKAATAPATARSAPASARPVTTGGFGGRD